MRELPDRNSGDDADRRYYRRYIMEPKETLKSAPGFDKDHWPSMADEQWAREVHTYYKTSPYWD
jgi:hypothetical protein